MFESLLEPKKSPFAPPPEPKPEPKPEPQPEASEAGPVAAAGHAPVAKPEGGAFSSLFSYLGHGQGSGASKDAASEGGPGPTPTPTPTPTPAAPTVTPAPVPTPAPAAGVSAPAAAPPKSTPEQIKEAETAREGLDKKMEKLGDLKPEQREIVKKRLQGLSGDALVAEMSAIDRALTGPNGDRALAAYSDLSTMIDKDPKAKERLTPEVMAMMVNGVGDRRTESDRGQAGIMGARQTRDAAQGLVNMGQEDYEKTLELLSKAGKDDQGKPITGADPRAEQSLILKALAARRDKSKEESWLAKIGGWFGYESEADKAQKDIDGFAKDIRGTKREDLIRTTTLMDVDDQNTSTIEPDSIAANNDTKSDNDGLYQRYNDSCTVAVAQIAKGEADPVYALKVHRDGVNNPNPGTDTGKEQKDVLEKNGGGAVSRLGTQASKALSTQITNAEASKAITSEQSTAINKLVTGGKMTPEQEKLAKDGLAKLREQNGGHPTDDEVAAMQGDAGKVSAGVSTGRLPLQDITKESSHIDYKDHDLTSGGLNSHLPGIEALLKDGQTVPVRVNWAGGGAHAMMISDSRTNADGSKKFLVTDPWTGATRWVPQADLADGSFATKHFGGSQGTLATARVDQSQNP